MTLMTRKPAAAGTFYPSDPRKLTEAINRFNPKNGSLINAQGVMLPHAGYIYSGEVATVTVSRLMPKKKVIILGPNHTGLGEPFSIVSEGAWEIPGAMIPVDSELAQRILQNGKHIAHDPIAHLHEHAIEVELPVLYHFFKSFSFVPLCCAHASITTCREIARQIAAAAQPLKDDLLLVASSDMSHYEEEGAARAKDRLATESILKLDSEELLNRVDRENISMCGATPVAIMMECCKLLRANKTLVTLYKTSGEVSGDYSAVVGYLGVIIH